MHYDSVIARVTLDCVCYTGLCYTGLCVLHWTVLHWTVLYQITLCPLLLWLLWFCILYHSQSIFVSTHVSQRSHTVSSIQFSFSSCLVLSCLVLCIYIIIYSPDIVSLAYTLDPLYDRQLSFVVIDTFAVKNTLKSCHACLCLGYTHCSRFTFCVYLWYTQNILHVQFGATCNYRIQYIHVHTKEKDENKLHI